MEYRKFGTTELSVSVIGFGAWGIGGGAMAGNIPIGWGETDDRESIRALEIAYDRGVTFYDTADFYGLGHSEELIGKTIARKDAVIATKVGHSLNPDGSIALNYSKKYILNACDESLKRIGRDYIDFYQLHSAKVEHLDQGECVEAMEILRDQGKIRYWGLSLNTYHPEPEAEYMITHAYGSGFQLVLNVINQRSLPIIKKAAEKGYGIIARMPLQFGLLTGKFSRASTFTENDHRSFRLPPALLDKLLSGLEQYWAHVEKSGVSKTSFSLSFCASVPGVSTVIPGIKTPEQALSNTTDIISLDDEVMASIYELGRSEFAQLLIEMEKAG
jgi:aryl-alcohol dehydrogenase-like predicted oxidoreductase